MLAPENNPTPAVTNPHPPGAPDDGPIAGVQHLAAMVASLQAQVEQLHRAGGPTPEPIADHSSVASTQTDAELASLRAELARTEEEARRALAHSATLAQRCLHAEKTSALAAACSEPEAAHLLRRRARLSLQRRLLAERADQLVRAKQLLEERLSQAGAASADTSAVEQRERALAEKQEALSQKAAALEKHELVLIRREGELVAERETLARRLAMPAGHSALSGAAAASGKPASGGTPSPRRTSPALGAIAWASAIVAVSWATIPAASWWVAGIADNPTYLANCVIAIEDGAEAPSDEAIDAWRSYQTELLDDPLFMENATERLKRRGFSEFSGPTDLRRMIESGLSVDESTPGQLTLTLRADGRTTSRRVLEALSGAMVTAANDTRDLRADGRSTVLLEPTRREDMPVRSERLTWFAGFSIAGLALATLGAAAMMVQSGRTRRDEERATAARETGGGEESWLKSIDDEPA